MSASKATPGPLGIRAAKALQKENARRLMAREEFLTQEEIAALIEEKTAAPDLLEACKARMKALAALLSLPKKRHDEPITDEERNVENLIDHADDLAISAIAKAKGGAE